MATTLIRVPAETHARLQRLAGELGQPLGQVVETALEHFERARMLTDFNAAFARLRADPEASANDDAELAAWDSTLLDGLEDERWEE